MFQSRLRFALVLALLVAFSVGTADAGFWKSLTGSFKALGSAIGDGLTALSKLPMKMGEGIYDFGEMIFGGGGSGGSDSSKPKVDPKVAALAQTHGFMRHSFALAGTTFGEKKEIGFKIERPGEVYVQVVFTGAPALAVILNGPGQVGFFDRVDSPSPAGFSFTVTNEHVQKGLWWKLTVADFTKSNKPSTGTISAFVPRNLGVIPIAATAGQRTFNMEKDLGVVIQQNAEFKSKIALLESQVSLLIKKLQELQHRINAVDHKDDGKPKG